MRFHTPRRTTAMVSLGLTALMSACSAGHTAVVEKAATDAIVLAATLSATSLDFTTTGSAAIPAALMSNVYETLVTIDPHSGAIQPGLAKSWDISPDNLTYTFHLREGVTFSNGDAFTASTAAFSINYVRNHWTNTLAAQMSPVAAARAVDDHTLEVTLNAPSQRWLWSMSTAVGAMMSPRGVDDLAAKASPLEKVTPSRR